MRVLALMLGVFISQCRTLPPEQPAAAPVDGAQATTLVAIPQAPVVEQEVALAKVERKTKKAYCDEWSQVVCASDNTSIYAPHLCAIGVVAGTGFDANGSQVFRGDNYCELISDLSQKFCKSDVVPETAPLEVTCAPDATQGECPLKPTLCELGDSVPVPQTCRITAYDGNSLPDSYQLRAQGEDTCFIKVSLFQQACALNLRPSLLGSPECSDSPR